MNAPPPPQPLGRAASRVGLCRETAPDSEVFVREWKASVQMGCTCYTYKSSVAMR